MSTVPLITLAAPATLVDRGSGGLKSKAQTQAPSGQAEPSGSPPVDRGSGGLKSEARAETPSGQAEPSGSPPVDPGSPDRASQRSSTSVRIGAIGLLMGVLALIAWHVVRKTVQLHPDSFTGLYTIMISGYVLSRFALAAVYRPPKDAGLEPACAVIVPAYNEGEAVARTIHALMALDYPPEKLEIVVINDGSTDDTWQNMTQAAAQYEPERVRLVDLGSNQGKRAAMAAGIRATSAEILVFVDSDSMPARDGVRRLVQGFADPQIGRAHV